MTFDEKFTPEQEIITGKQSAITPSVLALCKNIPGEGAPLIHNIADYIHSLNFVKTEKPDFSRTADEIIQSNFNYGCHEAGVVFATILRAKGIPVTYMETLLREDVAKFVDATSSRMGGHIFLKVQSPEGNIIVNATTGDITPDVPDAYVVVKEGLDSWDIGLKTPEDYEELFLEAKKDLKQVI